MPRSPRRRCALGGNRPGQMMRSDETLIRPGWPYKVVEYAPWRAESRSAATVVWNEVAVLWKTLKPEVQVRLGRPTIGVNVRRGVSVLVREHCSRTRSCSFCSRSFCFAAAEGRLVREHACSRTVRSCSFCFGIAVSAERSLYARGARKANFMI